MTDERLDEQIRVAYENVELDPEAEERILANLLAAEQARDAEEPKPAGEVIAFPTTAKPKRRHPSWIAPASIAAVLLIGIFVGMNLRPSATANYDAAPMESNDGGSVGLTLKSETTSEEAASADADEAYDAADLETVVLADGRRFAIADAATDTAVPDELVWEDATVELTGDSCEVAVLEDGSALVRFAGDDTLYQAYPG